jgi:hypothetical protein
MQKYKRGKFMTIAPIDVQVNTIGQMETSQWVGTENKSAQQLAHTTKELYKEKIHNDETKVSENEKAQGQKIDVDDENAGNNSQMMFSKKKKKKKQTTEENLEKDLRSKDQRVGNLIDIVR